MASNKSGGNRRGTNRRKANNPKGRNQHDSGWMNVKDSPLTAAIGAAAAVGAGVFLWSRRNQISDQIGDLADQLSEARESLGWGRDDAEGGATQGGGRSQREIAEEALTLKEIGSATDPGQPPA